MSADLTHGELVFSKNTNGEVQSGGYSINNLFLNNGDSAFKDYNIDGKLYSIPVGLFVSPVTGNSNIISKHNELSLDNQSGGGEIVNDSLYSKLLSLLEFKGVNGTTKKRRKTSSKGTKKKR